MRSHAFRSAIAPAQGYVCLSCRYQIVRGCGPAKRRYQHNGGLRQDDQKATSLEPALANLATFLSKDRTTKSKQNSTRETSDSKSPRNVAKESSTSKDGHDQYAQQVLSRGSDAKSGLQAQQPSPQPRSPNSVPREDIEPLKAVDGSQYHDVSGKLDEPMGHATVGLSKKVSNSGKTTPRSSGKENADPPLNLPNDSKKTLISKRMSSPTFTKTKVPSPRSPALAKHFQDKSSAIKEAEEMEQCVDKNKAGQQSPEEAKSQDNEKTPKTSTKRVTKVPSKKMSKVQPKKITKVSTSPRPKVRKLVPSADHKGSDIVAPRTAKVPKGSSSKIEMICASDLNLTPVEIEQPRVPSLAYGLERVLFNQGVYQLQDPRSRVYNFDPYLQKIMPVAEFDFSALREYITSSRDESLQIIGKGQGKRYVGSTSSMSTVLSHFHFLLSQWRPINTSMLSKGFPEGAYHSFTELQRVPQAIFLRQKDGCYAIDADKQFDNSNVLSMLGKSMEKLLTLKTQDFEKYRRSNADGVTEEASSSPESYHYSTLGDFLMRSQLDAHDPRLPGTGMFDLKTRAVISIRMDVGNYEHGTGYEIKTSQGEFESYEREYYDMIRAAFLKYSMQVRMGRMDGIFVAFHNVERIFGFQYISLAEMDNTIHGQWDTSIGDQEFKLSLNLLNKVLDKATKKYPNTSIRIHFETRDAATPFMYIFAEPVTEEEVADVQNTNLAKAQEFERKVLGLDSKQDQGPQWEDIHANVEKTMDEDELGLSEDEVSAGAGDDLNHPRVISDIDLPGNMPEEDGGIDGATAVEEGRSENDLGEEEEEDGENEEDEEDEEDDKEDEDNEEKDEEETQEDEDKIEEGNLKDAEETNEHEENTMGEKVEEIRKQSFANQGNTDYGKNTTFTGQKQDSSEESGLMNAGSEESGEPLDAQDHASDSAKDIGSGQSHGESESSGATSPAPEDQTSGFEPPSHLTKSDPNFGLEADQSFLDDLSSEVQVATSTKTFSDDILAMTLSLRNKVNGRHVLRPTDMTAEDKWEVEYLLEEVRDQTRAKALYEACKLRRQKKLETNAVPDGEEELVSSYVRRLREMSMKGRAWRKKIDQKDVDTGKPISILGETPGDIH